MRLTEVKENSMRTVAIVSIVIASMALPAAAQMPDVKGGGVVASEPGKAAMVRTAEVSAEVVSIDKTARTITLKGPDGKVVEIDISDDVKNFDQIKVGDYVFVRFLQSLALELQKSKSPDMGIQGGAAVATAQPGEKPAIASGHVVTAIAKVTAVNRKAKTIDLKGPRGNTVTLDVHNPDQFKVVKVGDEVRVTYTEAVAISVEAAPKKKSAKKGQAKK